MMFVIVTAVGTEAAVWVARRMPAPYSTALPTSPAGLFHSRRSGAWDSPPALLITLTYVVRALENVPFRGLTALSNDWHLPLQ